MANIPVERDASKPWWLWLLGLLLLAFLVWLAFELFDDEPDADEIAGTEDNVGLIDDVDLSDDLGVEEVTVEEDLYETDPEVEVGPVMASRLQPGTPVRLQNVPVYRVIGDSTFWIGRDDGRRFLVVLAGLGESETGARGTDGVFNVDEDEMVSITGAIARMVDGDRGLSELTDADNEALRERDVYIRVNSRDDIEVMEGDAVMEGDVGLDDTEM
jgi:hypothetical protein